jgi:hypothetical protein
VKLTTRSTAEAFGLALEYEMAFATHGTLWAAVRRTGREFSVGQLPVEYHNSLRDAHYVVFSDLTPIAWAWYDKTYHKHWTVPDVKYSAATTRHQNKIRAALETIGVLPE